ncbi:hypothetical protein HXX76_001376 [Chlamydomonas incerta]|uniref:Uncharacterized protein n=1 Tax=Chlamydomonas incerta TaxID=51695 RepID=A0A835WC22_CHLIN|nr:hypothetical protein HXX76_001376 [Chlamydomonas incerta]|eukprot:KAG2444632.1 hypothetical protein HXX76_001376 [Chlamydomonas incerta]
MNTAAFDDSLQLQLQGGAFNMSASSGSMVWPQNAANRAMPGGAPAARPPSLNTLVANPAGLIGGGGQAAHLTPAQQQQQLQQQIQQLQAAAGGGSQVFTLNNGTRVVKAGQPYPNTTIVQNLPTGQQQLGMANVQRPPVMVGQGQIGMAQPVNLNALGLSGLQGQAGKLAFMQQQQQQQQHQQLPQQHVLVAQPQQVLQQAQAAKLHAGMGMPGGGSLAGLGAINVAGVNGMAVRPGAVYQPGVAMRQGPMGASGVRPLNMPSNSITLQQVFAPPPANITTTITSVRPAMRIPKLGTVATYNPVTGVRSATTNGVTPGGAGGAGGTPALPAGLPASLVQQVNLLQQQGGLLQPQLLGQPSGAMAVRPGTLLNGGVNATSGSQRQTTVVVGSNGITALQQQQQQAQQQQAQQQQQQQVVNITLADGTTTTTVLDQATLARMLSETSRGQAAKIQLAANHQHQQQHQQQQQQQQMRQIAAAVNQQQQQQQFLQLQQSLNGGLQQVQLSGAPSQMLVRTSAQQQLQQQLGGRGMQDNSPTAASAGQMLGGMQMLNGQGGFLQAATSQHQQQGGGANGSNINIFDGNSAALAQQLQSAGASQQQMIDGLSVVDLNSIVDQHQQQNGSQSNSQNAPHLRANHLGMGGAGGGAMSNMSSGPQQQLHHQQQQQPDMSGSSMGHLTLDDAASHQNGSGGGEACGPDAFAAGMNGGGGGAGLGGLGIGMGMAGVLGSSREDLKMILVSIGQELARHGISVETAVTSGWLGVLSPMDVAVLAEAYAEEERRVTGQPLSQQQQMQMQLQLQHQMQLQGQQMQAMQGQMHSGSQPQLQHLHGSSGGADSGGSFPRPLSGLSIGSGLGGFGPAGPGSGTAPGSAAGGGATNGSNSNPNSDMPLGEIPSLGLGGGNTTCSADRSAAAAILALTSSSARTSMSVPPSEDGNGNGGGADGPPSAPAAPLAGGTSTGSGNGNGLFDRDSTAAAVASGASGGNFGAFQYGLFGLGGLVQPGGSLSAEHDRPVDRSDDAAALADVFGEKPWPPGLGLMAEELGLNAQQHSQPQQCSGPGPKLIDSASEYEARRQAAAAAAAAVAAAACVGGQPRAASSDCHAAVGGVPSGGVGALVPLAALAASKANLSAPVAAVATIAAPDGAADTMPAESDKEMAKRFANLDLGCGFY